MTEFRIIENDDGWIVIYRNGVLMEEGRFIYAYEFLKNLEKHLKFLDDYTMVPLSGDFPAHVSTL